MGIDVNNVYPSKYLKASDLQGRTVKVEIANAAMEKMGNDTKLVIYFRGKDKGMVLNKSNAQQIAAVYSPNTDGWIGKEIKLYPGKTQFNGQMVDSLKVEVVPPTAEIDDALPPF